MSVTKVFHGINLALIIVSLSLSAGILLFTLPYAVMERGIPADPIVYLSIAFPVLGFIWIGLFIWSFNRSNLDSKYFLASAILNILAFLWLVGMFISAWFISYSNSFIDALPFEVGGALIVSFILFLVGCFTKREKS